LRERENIAKRQEREKNAHITHTQTTRRKNARTRSRTTRGSFAPTARTGRSFSSLPLRLKAADRFGAGTTTSSRPRSERKEVLLRCFLLHRFANDVRDVRDDDDEKTSSTLSSRAKLAADATRRRERRGEQTRRRAFETSFGSRAFQSSARCENFWRTRASIFLFLASMMMCLVNKCARDFDFALY